MNSSLQSKMETSIATIQKAAKLAQNYTGKPLVVAFSGGKDSQTVYHLAEAAGVDYEAVYSARISSIGSKKRWQKSQRQANTSQMTPRRSSSGGCLINLFKNSRQQGFLFPRSLQ